MCHGTGTRDRKGQKDLKLQPREELEGRDCSNCLQLHIGTSRALCLSGSQRNVKGPDCPKDTEVTASTYQVREVNGISQAARIL